MQGVICVGCAVPEVRVGDVGENVRQICNWIQKGREENCQVVVFPELALTGYTCGDLFFQQLLQDKAREGLGTITAFTGQYPEMTVVVGLPLMLDGRLYNCAAVICGGAVKGIVPKTHLPNHAPANERRWFAAARELRCTEAAASTLGLTGEYTVPVGAGRVFALPQGAAMGVEICEDLFATASPSVDMALKGAELIVNLAASPQTVGRGNYRRLLVRQQSDRCRCAYAFCSAGYTESTADLVFSGHSLIAQQGAGLAENEKTLDTGYLIRAAVDIGAIRAARCRDTTFTDGAVSGEETHFCAQPVSADGGLPVTRQPFATDPASSWEIFQIQVTGLMQRLKLLKAKPVVGVSGGLDSALALLVAAEAVRRLGWPADSVHGITMPCFGTTKRTKSNAGQLMALLGVTAKEIPIGRAVEQHFLDIGHDPALHDTTYENAQARERTQVLMDYAGKIGGIVVGTGDLSELALGWCTYNGDHMSMYAVNASVLKTQIPGIIRAAAETEAFAEAKAVLEDIIATPISPELLPGEQKTEDAVGPYCLHDFFLHYHLKYGFAPGKLFDLTCGAFAGEYDADTVKKWLKVFYRRFFTQQFKRSCMPEGAKAGELSLNPRCDFLMGGDVSPALWLAEAEKL